MHLEAKVVPAICYRNGRGTEVLQRFSKICLENERILLENHCKTQGIH